MAARATRSASRAASSGDDNASRCLLLALSHDELGVIVDGLADPLQPVVAVALSSTCLGLRTPLKAVLEVLKERHGRATALCRKMGTSCVELRERMSLNWAHLTVDDVATLGMILRTRGLPKLQTLCPSGWFGDEGMSALCEGLSDGAAPSVRTLTFMYNKIGPAGAEVLAAALRRGAMPKLEKLVVVLNPIGKQGFAALAPSLRKLPAIHTMILRQCGMCDEGMASLFGNLDKDEFKELKRLEITSNATIDHSCALLIAAVKAGSLPAIDFVEVEGWPTELHDAINRAIAHRLKGVT